jgi:hypothetical protein
VIDQVVALDHHRLIVDRAGVGVEITRVEIVGVEGPVLVVPHDLARDLRVVGIDDGKRQPRHVADQRAPIGCELGLAGVTLGGLAVGVVQRHLAIGDDAHLHPVLETPADAGRNEIGDGSGIGLGHDVARLHIALRRRGRQRSADEQRDRHPAARGA